MNKLEGNLYSNLLVAVYIRRNQNLVDRFQWKLHRLEDMSVPLKNTSLD